MRLLAPVSDEFRQAWMILAWRSSPAHPLGTGPQPSPAPGIDARVARPHRQHRQVANRAPAVFVQALAVLAATQALRGMADLRQRGEARHAKRALKSGNGKTFAKREVEFRTGHESGGYWNRLIGRTTGLVLRAPPSFLARRNLKVGSKSLRSS